MQWINLRTSINWCRFSRNGWKIQNQLVLFILISPLTRGCALILHRLMRGFLFSRHIQWRHVYPTFWFAVAAGAWTWWRHRASVWCCCYGVRSSDVDRRGRPVIGRDEFATPAHCTRAYCIHWNVNKHEALVQSTYFFSALCPQCNQIFDVFFFSFTQTLRFSETIVHQNCSFLLKHFELVSRLIKALVFWEIRTKDPFC